MKTFALENPAIFSFFVFFAFIVGGTLAGFIFGVFIVSGDCKPISPSDPCDGRAMASGFFFLLFVISSCVVGLVVSIKTFMTLKVKAILN